MPDDLLYIGAGNQVAAVDPHDGHVVWQTALREAFFKAGHDFVSLLVDGDVVYAHAYGHLYALDARTGTKRWENALKGFGPGIASLALRDRRSMSPGQGPFIVNAEAKEDGGD